ncbi:hypothetical protein [Desulfatirhabdium butyrativorans]|uniref:hypothetical protein n=1 Tax=Desulfatirhabdium butyrativorans TaxID=340467 RepID=UPI00040C4FAD|nr:hypothetical protein [Desulfatirhabdium butyrativorans]
MSESYGAYRDGISTYHKIWVIDSSHDVTVVGYLGEGTSKEIVSNWETPFADSSLAARYRIASGALQMLNDTTLQGTINSRQAWAGNQPYTFNLVLKFRAFTDPYTEVEGAIRALEMMMAPDPINSMSMRIPAQVSINFGRLQTFPDCVIKSLSVPYDKEKNAEGYLIRADVSLQVESHQAVTRTEIQNSYKKS